MRTFFGLLFQTGFRVELFREATRVRSATKHCNMNSDSKLGMNSRQRGPQNSYVCGLATRIKKSLLEGRVKRCRSGTSCARLHNRLLVAMSVNMYSPLTCGNNQRPSSNRSRRACDLTRRWRVRQLPELKEAMLTKA